MLERTKEKEKEKDRGTSLKTEREGYVNGNGEGKRRGGRKCLREGTEGKEKEDKDVSEGGKGMGM